MEAKTVLNPEGYEFTGTDNKFFINDFVSCYGKEYQISEFFRSNHAAKKEIDWLELWRQDNGVVFKQYATPAEVKLISRPVA